MTQSEISIVSFSILFVIQRFVFEIRLWTFWFYLKKLPSYRAGTHLLKTKMNLPFFDQIRDFKRYFFSYFRDFFLSIIQTNLKNSFLRIFQLYPECFFFHLQCHEDAFYKKKKNFFILLTPIENSTFSLKKLCFRNVSFNSSSIQHEKFSVVHLLVLPKKKYLLWREHTMKKKL